MATVVDADKAGLQNERMIILASLIGDALWGLLGIRTLVLNEVLICNFYRESATRARFGPNFPNEDKID